MSRFLLRLNVWLTKVYDLITVKKGGTVLRPSLKHFNKGVAFVPLSIGEHCMIEDNCVVSAAQIGNYVHLGADSIIGRRAVIKGSGYNS